MNRKELVDMILAGTSVVRDFLGRDGADGSTQGSYDDWSENDVVGHIVGWMDYSIDKLSSLKLGTVQGAEYQGITSLDGINAILYAKTRGAPREEIESKYLNALGGYIKIVSAFSEADLESRAFDTGFDMELRRYMLMDTVIHPVQHVLYQCLKRERYGTLADALGRTEDIFTAYASGHAGYRLAEFNVDTPAYRDRFGRLHAAFPANEAVAAFIRANQAPVA